MTQRHQRHRLGRSLASRLASAALALAACSASGRTRGSDADDRRGPRGGRHHRLRRAAPHRGHLRRRPARARRRPPSSRRPTSSSRASTGSTRPATDGTCSSRPTEGFQVLDTGAWTADGEHRRRRARAHRPRLRRADARATSCATATRPILFSRRHRRHHGLRHRRPARRASEDGELPETETISVARGPPRRLDRARGRHAAHHDRRLRRRAPASRVLDADRRGDRPQRGVPVGARRGHRGQDEVAVFGCSDGVLVYDDGAFTKIAAAGRLRPHGQRLRHATRRPSWSGDYNSDPDAEGYALTAAHRWSTRRDDVADRARPARGRGVHLEGRRPHRRRRRARARHRRRAARARRGDRRRRPRRTRSSTRGRGRPSGRTRTRASSSRTASRT